MLCGSRTVSDFGRRSVDGGLILAPPFGAHSQVAGLRDKLSVQGGIVLGRLAPRHVCRHAITLHADPSRAVGKQLRRTLKGNF